MQIAIKDTKRSRAFWGATGFRCPGCDGEVLPKCGSKNVHHWAHTISADCDTWSEPEGEWHLYWKSLFPEDWLEVVMGENREHRADIRRPDGLVIELQHSSILFPEAEERCEFYGDIIWVFNAHQYISRCSILCWHNEYPPRWNGGDKPPEWFGKGSWNTDLTLSCPDQIWSRNSEFHSSTDKGSLSISVSMSEVNEDLASASFISWDIKKVLERIVHCKERLRHFAGKDNKIIEWSSKLKKAEEELASWDTSICFLKQAVPVNAEEFKLVEVAGVQIEGVPLRIKWSHPRQAFSELECPYLWDFDKDYILFFPAVEAKRQVKPFLESVLLKKNAVIAALRKI